MPITKACQSELHRIEASYGRSRTVANDIAHLILSNGEEGRPFVEVVKVEIDVVVFREGIEVRQIHAKEILRLALSEGGHG